MVMALVATGCLDGDVDLTVQGDGAGEVVAEVLLEPEAFAVLRDLDLAALVESQFNQAGDVEFERIERGGVDGFKVIVPFEDYRDLESVLVGGVDVLGVRVQLFTKFDLQRSTTDDSWTLDAVALPFGEILESASAVPGLDSALAAAGAGIAGTALKLSISLPGEVTESNSEKVDGGTATWQLEQFRTPAQLRMRTEPAEFPTTVQKVLGGIALVVIVGIVLTLWGATASERSRNSKGRSRRAARRGRKKGKGSDSSSGWGPPGTPRTPVAAAPTPDRGGALPPLAGGAPAMPAPPPVPPVPPAPAPLPPSAGDGR